MEGVPAVGKTVALSVLVSETRREMGSKTITPPG